MLVAGAARAAVPSSGELRLFVVPAGFPDRPFDRPTTHVVGAPEALVDRMAAYWHEVSAGRLRVVPLPVGPTVTLPEARARYVQRPADMARHAIAAAAAAGTPADRAALEAADAVVVFFAGPGRESHTRSGDPDDPWSNYAVLAPPARVGGAVFDEALVIAAEEVPPFSSFGVLCHEFGHLLGLPELYAPGGRAHEGVGVWDLMGQGTWLGAGERPPHPSAWSKLQLGWVDVETVDRTRARIELPAVGRTPRVLKIPATPDVPEEYYLVENRRREGADAALPGEGILVWHVDERVGGFRSAQNDPAHKLLHLVEADGRNDLDRGHAAGGNRGDAGDPWAGPAPWRRRTAAALTLGAALVVASAVFRMARPRPLVPVLVRLGLAAIAFAVAVPLRRAPVCGPGTPGMTPYDGGPVRVVLRNFSPPAPVMSVDVLVAPAPSDIDSPADGVTP